MSFVYFAKNARGLVKIGTARDVRLRLRDIKVYSDVDVEIVGVMLGGVEKERELHKQFSSLRVRGEWFALEPPIQQFIDTNCEPYLERKHRGGAKSKGPVSEDTQRASQLLRELILPVIAGETIGQQVERACRALPEWRPSRVKHLWYLDSPVVITASDMAYIQRAVEKAENLWTRSMRFVALSKEFTHLSGRLNGLSV